MLRFLFSLLIMTTVFACTQNDNDGSSLKLDSIDKFVIKTLVQDSAVYTQEQVNSFLKDSSLMFRSKFNKYILIKIPYHPEKQKKYNYSFVTDLWLFDPKTNERIATYRLEGTHYQPWGIEVKDLNKDGEQDIVASIFWGVSSVPVDYIYLELIQLDKKDRKLKSTFFIREDERDCGLGVVIGTQIVRTFHFENKNKIAIKEEYYSFDCENYTDDGEEIKGKKKTKTLYQTLHWNEKEFQYK